MTHESSKPAFPVNDLENANEAENPSPRTQQSVFPKRKRRRRLDLRSLDGTARESASVYREFTSGKITAGELEVRSRHLRRHSEIVGTAKQAEQLAAIQSQLEALGAQRLDGSPLMATEFLLPKE
jgi:hypothetical protein